MKLRATFYLFVLLFAVSCQPAEKIEKLYVGTYTTAGSEGIYRFDYNPKDGTISNQQVTPNLANPSFIEISPNQKNLYAVSEIKDFNNLDSGSVTAYSILADGSLSKLNQVATLGNHPCHVTVSPNGKTVVASNYTSGSISIYSVEEDGSLVEPAQLIQHLGSGPDTARQAGPHAHSSQFGPEGQILYSADLGIDKLLCYQYDVEAGKYIAADQPYVAIQPGAGPRHFDFSPQGDFIYVMTEMASAVSVLKKTDQGWTVIQTVSSLPADFDGVKAGADIHLSSDGRFVYCSNRGMNTIAVFERDLDSGEIKLIQNEPTQGDWPRNFALSPDGNFVLVANQNSNNIAIFKRDTATGKLSFTGNNYELPSPVCLKFLEL